jgi:molecular chaperone DnaK (HSP70)
VTAPTVSGDFHLGVDFGTSTTVAVLRDRDGRVRPLVFDGSELLPSAVCAFGDGTLLVGRDALGNTGNLVLYSIAAKG